MSNQASQPEVGLPLPLELFVELLCYLDPVFLPKIRRVCHWFERAIKWHILHNILTQYKVQLELSPTTSGGRPHNEQTWGQSEIWTFKTIFQKPLQPFVEKHYPHILEATITPSTQPCPLAELLSAPYCSDPMSVQTLVQKLLRWVNIESRGRVWKWESQLCVNTTGTEASSRYTANTKPFIVWERTTGYIEVEPSLVLVQSDSVAPNTSLPQRISLKKQRIHLRDIEICTTKPTDKSYTLTYSVIPLKSVYTFGGAQYESCFESALVINSFTYRTHEIHKTILSHLYLSNLSQIRANLTTSNETTKAGRSKVTSYITQYTRAFENAEIDMTGLKFCCRRCKAFQKTWEWMAGHLMECHWEQLLERSEYYKDDEGYLPVEYFVEWKVKGDKVSVYKVRTGGFGIPAFTIQYDLHRTYGSPVIAMFSMYSSSGYTLKIESDGSTTKVTKKKDDNIMQFTRGRDSILESLNNEMGDAVSDIIFAHQSKSPSAAPRWMMIQGRLSSILQLIFCRMLLGPSWQSDREQDLISWEELQWECKVKGWVSAIDVATNNMRTAYMVQNLANVCADLSDRGMTGSVVVVVRASHMAGITEKWNKVHRKVPFAPLSQLMKTRFQYINPESFTKLKKEGHL
ncbi:hypothetical protein HDV00_009767 [Rhizophlyctis rosea]|nr:hypothetical protein HDV00_009767 [Rhizophlyctis rosea]